VSDYMGEVSSMIRCALFLEIQLDIEILSIGRGGVDRVESCTLEGSGKNLAYFVILDGSYVFLRAQVLDGCDDSEELVSVPDTKDGWLLLCRVIQSLARNNVKSLTRPIESGSGGPHCYVID
jgi:hypothetical protein